MSQIFTIEHDKVVIKKLALETLEGNISHLGELDLSGPVNINSTLTVDTLKVKHLETEGGVDTKFGEWAVKEEADLLTKGLSWSWVNGTVHLAYRTNNRLWTSGHMDIDQNRSYMVDGVAVLSANELSPELQRVT